MPKIRKIYKIHKVPKHTNSPKYTKYPKNSKHPKKAKNTHPEAGPESSPEQPPERPKNKPRAQHSDSTHQKNEKTPTQSKKHAPRGWTGDTPVVCFGATDGAIINTNPEHNNAAAQI